ncbi:MAG: prepilin peptidase [Emcibacter sp.]|nr:prepilin peptidase [Emcibacter sp.]
MPEVLELFHHHMEIYYIFSMAFGLVIGSFLNVVIYRLPRMEERDWINSALTILSEYGFTVTGRRSDLVGDDFTLSYPPSSCPECQQRIKFWQNIPIVSYLLQAGKCSHCGGRISLRYPLIELVTGLLFFGISLRFGMSIQAICLMFFISMLVVLSAIDFDSHHLLDSVTLPLMWGGIIVNLFGLYVDINAAVIGAIAGYSSLWVIYWLYLLIRGKEALGYGDFKLFAALGAWAGWQALPLILLLATVSGLVGGTLLMILGRGQKLAFGPYLALGGGLMMMWGADITQKFTVLMAGF